MSRSQRETSGQAVQQATALMARITALNFQLTALAEQAHAMGGLAAGRRALLLDLHRHDLLTVPRLADMRPVSRQYVQRLVDGLLEDGYVEAVPNPQHKRSPFYRLTRAGRAHVARIDRREAPMFERFVQLVDGATVARTAALLDEIARAVQVIADEQAGVDAGAPSGAHAARPERARSSKERPSSDTSPAQSTTAKHRGRGNGSS